MDSNVAHGGATTINPAQTTTVAKVDTAFATMTAVKADTRDVITIGVTAAMVVVMIIVVVVSTVTTIAVKADTHDVITIGVTAVMVVVMTTEVV
ncbi:hypothetical protein HMPREF9241_00729, partial [Schaalia turicensis ACS-279-V-Col4]